MHKRPISLAKLRRVPPQFSWVDQRLVRERVIDHLSHEACALYLFLVTVADAQGLSFYADRSLCQRLSMALPVLHQARQALIQRGLVAYQRPLYQVLALGREDRAEPARSSTDDEAVDIKAVFKHIWEVLS
jgi:hypothetical protein